jgi:hypothetical protein
MAVAAGSVCTVAVAAPENKAGRRQMQFGGTVTATHMIVQGRVIPLANPGGTDGPQVVYDNGIAVPPVGTPTTGAFSTTSEPNEHVMDVISFNPGPGAGSGVLLTTAVMNIAIGGTVATLPNDAIALRYRVWDTVNAAATPVTSDLRGDVTLIFAAPAAGWASGFYYVSDPPISLTALPGGGIQTSDDLIGVDHHYLTTMIDPVTQMPVATTTAHPDATVVFADFSGTVTLSVGSSELTYWRDANANGEFSPDELRQFAAPAVANFVMSLTGQVGGGGGGCYANCDGSTSVPFLNINDFVCFQQAFAAGQSYANCDGSTALPNLNINDFVCFQQAFAAGCSAP